MRKGLVFLLVILLGFIGIQRVSAHELTAHELAHVLQQAHQTPTTFEGFGISLSTNKSIYAPNEPIIMKLKVFNLTDETITFHFSTAQRFDFSVVKEMEIWRWSNDMFFAQVLGELILDPEKIVVYEEKYEEELEAGSYRVIGEVPSIDKALTASLTIIIKEGY